MKNKFIYALPLFILMTASAGVVMASGAMTQIAQGSSKSVVQDATNKPQGQAQTTLENALKTTVNTTSSSVRPPQLLAINPTSKMAEVRALLTAASQESGRPTYSEDTAVPFPAHYNVFVKSALDVDFTDDKATVTLPMYRGISPRGKSVYYIITEASDFEVAKAMGINYAPKMRHVVGTAGAQNVSLRNGLMSFRGNVDFAPEYVVEPGSPEPFPPNRIAAGAIADERWSSMVVMPSGVVLNAQLVHNDSGSHDRMKDLNLEQRTVTLSILDGVQGGRRHFYHLVTDASAEIAAVLEQGVYAPKLAQIPNFGQSVPEQPSALLGFSPVLNGISNTGTKQHQGFVASLANGGIDPINIFPLPPSNYDPSLSNNYSPMWDAHVSAWTDEAIANKAVRRVLSFDDLGNLIEAGLISDASINPDGPENPWLYGLRPTQAIINCPVIAHPVLPD